MSLLQKLDPSWQVNDMFIEINETELRMRDLLTYELMWHGDHVEGIISFQDIQNFQDSIKIDVGGLVKVGFTSQEKTSDPAYWEQTFVITKVNYADGGKMINTKVCELYLKDMVSQQLTLSHFAKSFIAKPIEEIFTGIFDGLGINPPTMAMNPDREPMTILTPAHKSMFETLKHSWNEEGLSFIQDRHASYLVHDIHRTNDKALHTGEFFEYKPKNYWSRSQVIEYKIKGFDMESLEKSIPSVGNSINNSTARSDEVSVKTTKNIPQGGTLGGGSVNVLDMYVGKGQKQNAGLYTSKTSETLTKDIKDIQQMSIWVPGWNGNRLGMKVRVEMPRPTHIVQDEHSEAYTGDWVVNKVRDKIISSYFVQELFLSRAGA